MIKIQNLNVGYREKKVIQNLNIDFAKGEFCALLGPNGAGKSTLLKTLVKFLIPMNGEIFLNDQDFGEISNKELAKFISIIPQDFQLQFDYNVFDLVLMGRFPYQKYWQGYSKEDRNIVDNILQRLNLKEFKNKMYSQLSGGEKQRVSIARALAQETPIILMDEAFANLDVNYQVETMQLLSEINRTENKTIILVSHNINLASDYCDRILMMKEGKLTADGKPDEVISEENIKKLYGAELQIITNPVSGKPNLIYPGKR
ncbi:MAG: ABC transporter ATP-binding protein [Candidatus Cloacimonetes bacterium]|nr:ABC transporter ATP-binding protein [Candidatus Cloacimonadota bacterium]